MLNVPICTQGMQRTWWPEAGTVIVIGPYCYGIRGIALDWFSSYLTNRSQTVIYNEQESEMKETLCGVPQGSILGPLLFLLYINDLPSVSNLFMPILFADDTNLFCNGPNLDELIEKNQ